MPSPQTSLKAPDPGPGAEPGPGGEPGAGRRGFGQAGGPPPREPALKAPWPALSLALLFPLTYALQHLGGGPALAAQRFGFRPASLADGGWTGLFTAPFVHGGWTHAIFNALAALAFGAPVARRLGASAAGAAGFAVLFMATAVIGSLGYALFHAHDAAVLVGASGGVAGLMGAASRMIPPAQGGRLLPLLSRPVLAMAGAWAAANLVLALVGLDVGTGGAPVAWQAHLFGYAAGLFGIAPLLTLVRGRG